MDPNYQSRQPPVWVPHSPQNPGPQHNRIPGWLGPIVGPVVGGAMGLWAALQNPGAPILLVAGGAAALGLVAGGIVWFMDMSQEA